MVFETSPHSPNNLELHPEITGKNRLASDEARRSARDGYMQRAGFQTREQIIQNVKGIDHDTQVLDILHEGWGLVPEYPDEDFRYP